MRISDWSSDVCSSDLHRIDRHQRRRPLTDARQVIDITRRALGSQRQQALALLLPPRWIARRSGFGELAPADRKSDVWGKSVSVRLDLGGRRIIKKKKYKANR